jgi:outer membrane biosynthesis protein TonB
VLRRNFRIGLLVGLLGGALVAVAKAVQGRVTGAPSTAPAPAPWTPLPDAEPVVVPPKPAPPVERPTVRIADLQESPEPAPAKKAAAPTKKPAPKPAPWVEPVDGEAPPTHPVKAKMSSMIYHLPGGLNYVRTKADRCYRDADAAEADGLRPAKR